ncbi:protein TIC 62 chloroplastic [Tripterygium wilfordii]|uniref:Protein TIC 62 chloroplastic n=1 Tax=Tripterygium wilfordii TaxID=458696 RepID=A0A7J7DZC8_TRIWF|nr:protein TIC 62 chloroplastic [Tripterygium wilfordii]
MAPALTSTSFLLTFTPNSRQGLKKPRFTVLAKTPFSAFQLRKTKEEPSKDDKSNNNAAPFSFNFGKVPDVRSLIPVVSNLSSGLSFVNDRRKDPANVFVAGATGQASVRIVQTLLREGFSVRAGVPDLGQAQDLARLAAQYKVVQVSSNPSAPLRSVDELFSNCSSTIPEDGKRKAYADALAKAKAEEAAKTAADKASEAVAKAKKLEDEVKKLSEEEARATSLAEEAQQKAEAAGSFVESLLSKAKEMSSGFSWEKVGSQIATVVQKMNDKPKVHIATVWGQAKARSLTPNKVAVQQSALKLKMPSSKLPEKPKPKGKETESKAKARKVFGGLFQQETIYVDDD